MKVLYCGSNNGTSKSRKNGLINMGYDVHNFELEKNILTNFKWFQYLEQKSLNSLNLKTANNRLINDFKKVNPDLVWIDKGTYIYKETLEGIKKNNPNTIMVHHNTDDIESDKHQFDNYLSSLDLYDAHFTCNKFNIDYLKKISNSHFFYNEIGYDQNIFYPRKRDKKYDIFFIGHHEPDYEKYVSEIINKDIKFFLGGPGWHSSNIPKSKIAFNHFNEKIYPKIINQSFAGLGLYSKWNRNISSGRIFEIPATKVALIVKRNNFIESLYKEDSEAIFFDNPRDFSSKLEYLFKNQNLLQEIANNGYERCLNNKCTWDDRIKEAIDCLKQEKII
ncbi:MAG: glycosyltransferase [Candidatus Marinimicrobia bacterium]|nr:glycosyltransferase [Candidatus Neomarinimicrobiota bacterium]